MPDPLQRGAFVIVTAGTSSVRAMVVLASSNGRSLMLMFDGALRINDGLAIGMLPVSQEDDGTWREIMFQTPVSIFSDDHPRH